MSVQPDDYMDKLVEYGIMKIFALCVVDETHQAWCEEDDFQVVKPPMNIEVRKSFSYFLYLVLRSFSLLKSVLPTVSVIGESWS